MRRTQLEKIRGVIARHRRLITNAEELVRYGLGPFDIEKIRVGLAELIGWERWLIMQIEQTQVGRNGEAL